MFSFRFSRWIIISSAIPTFLAAQKIAGKPTLEPPASKERHALDMLLTTIEEAVVPAAEAMPADKYGFAPRDGEFAGVRTFSRQVKHLAATNHMLAAAALGQAAPADAGDEAGPDAIVSKPDIMSYLKSSFAALHQAVAHHARDRRVMSLGGSSHADTRLDTRGGRDLSRFPS